MAGLTDPALIRERVKAAIQRLYGTSDPHASLARADLMALYEDLEPAPVPAEKPKRVKVDA